MLTLKGVEAGYGSSKVLFGVDLNLSEGQLVAMMGRNGMGKTTTVRAITGLTPASAGSIKLEGQDITTLKPYQIGQAGIALVPEGRQVFSTLSVRENLVSTAGDRSGKGFWTLDWVFDHFPQLRERAAQLGDSLSGGEQQMLAIGRALMTNPRLLILDEATEGLAPLIRQEIWNTLELLKSQGQTILVIDKNLEEVARVADHAYVLIKGQVVWQGDMEAMHGVPDFAKTYLGV
ncbi:ABC transporter ATP-binding protein [Rhodobacteraceae bacterium nBUS_22]|jgi:branched-chain amino acid transport system ATP-binding protein